MARASVQTQNARIALSAGVRVIGPAGQPLGALGPVEADGTELALGHLAAQFAA